jgi:hypothetical protein
MGLRQLIASKLPSYELSGEVEADENYFGGVRKGKRGRGAAGKVAVCGLLKRGGKVYTARSVHTHHEEPQEHGCFREEGAGQIVGGQIAYQRI